MSFLSNSNGAQITRCYLESQGSARKANQEEPQRQSLPRSAGLTSMNSVHVYFTSGLSPRERGVTDCHSEMGEKDTKLKTQSQ